MTDVWEAIMSEERQTNICEWHRQEEARNEGNHIREIK